MAKNVTIYTGIVRLLYADNVKINKDVVIPKVKKEIVDDSSLFYVSFGEYINMEYACLLPDEEEATSYMEGVVQNRKERIMQVLNNPNTSIEERNAFLDYLRGCSSCVYFNSSDVKPSYSLPKNDFKEFRKSLARKKRENS